MLVFLLPDERLIRHIIYIYLQTGNRCKISTSITPLIKIIRTHKNYLTTLIIILFIYIKGVTWGWLCRLKVICTILFQQARAVLNDFQKSLIHFYNWLFVNDLRLPYFAIKSNLKSFERKIFRAKEDVFINNCRVNS